MKYLVHPFVCCRSYAIWSFFRRNRLALEIGPKQPYFDDFICREGVCTKEKLVLLKRNLDMTQVRIKRDRFVVKRCYH